VPDPALRRFGSPLALGALAISACLWSTFLSAQRVPGVRITGILNGELLTGGRPLRAESREPIEAIEFWFTPESRSDPVLLGVARNSSELAYGPDCGDGGAEPQPCFRQNVFSLDFGRALHQLSEGWGTLSVREPGATTDAASVRVYWDETPPRASFTSPQFNATLSSAIGWDVIAHTFDENIISIKVIWQLANGTSRNIPRFEQHELGADFAGHAACVPTTVAANLWWLHDTGQWFTRLGFFNEDFTVNSLGGFMNTTTSGTTGAGGVNGTVDYLNHWFGYENGVHYTLEHLGGADFGASATQVGFSPQQILQQFQAGGAISLGLHNTPPGPDVLFMDPPFGHFVALDNVVLNNDGTAWIRVMDPHLQPPATLGAYRWFRLLPNGQLEWTAANPGYYSPPSGRVALNELHILRDFVFIAVVSSAQNTNLASAVPERGEVPGALLPGGRVWQGRFKPPAGSPGPWLLVTESTDAAGMTQRDYLYVGGVYGTRPVE
jgi:hypothetical protein